MIFCEGSILISVMDIYTRGLCRTLVHHTNVTDEYDDDYQYIIEKRFLHPNRSITYCRSCYNLTHHSNMDRHGMCKTCKELRAT